eukprot:143548-Rhodomonas_salina.1
MPLRHVRYRHSEGACQYHTHTHPFPPPPPTPPSALVAAHTPSVPLSAIAYASTTGALTTRRAETPTRSASLVAPYARSVPDTRRASVGRYQYTCQRQYTGHRRQIQRSVPSTASQYNTLWSVLVMA